MSESSGGSGALTGRSGPPDGHSGCRIREFAQWDRLMLEHEREYLSRYMAHLSPFLKDAASTDLMHDITDIDYLLQQMAPRVEVP